MLDYQSKHNEQHRNTGLPENPSLWNDAKTARQAVQLAKINPDLLTQCHQAIVA